jgi:hypothetical protein
MASDEIHKEIERWLVGYYKAPDDHVKARITGEYVRGAGYFVDFMRYGSLLLQTFNTPIFFSSQTRK